MPRNQSNQWTGFYMIGFSVIKNLKGNAILNWTKA